MLMPLKLGTVASAESQRASRPGGITLGGNMTANESRIQLAKVALKAGRTRGQFICDNASPDTDKADLQSWSDAYSEAMRQLNNAFYSQPVQK
jgi:hypothetical protein